MSTWARELAPNLFNSYQDWLNNFRKEVGCDPDYDMLREADIYFAVKSSVKEG